MIYTGQGKTVFRKIFDYLFTPDYAVALKVYFRKRNDQLDDGFRGAFSEAMGQLDVQMETGRPDPLGEMNLRKNALISRALKNASSDSTKYIKQ